MISRRCFTLGLLVLILLWPFPKSFAGPKIELQDLSSFSFEGKRVKSFQEPWVIVWGKLLEGGEPIPEEGDASLLPMQDFKNLPALQKADYSLNPQDGFGAGTFLKRLKGLRPLAQGYDLANMGVSTAMRLCVYPEARPSHQSCLDLGKPGLSKQTTTPKIMPSVLTFFPESPEEVWIISAQVANFNCFTGGLRYGAPELSAGGVLRSQYEKAHYNDFAAMGFLGAIMAYSFMLWARRTDDFASLSLAVLCSMTMTRLMIATQLIYNYVEPSPRFFEIKYALEYATLIGGPAAYLWFIHEAFTAASFKKVFLFFEIAALPFVIYPFFSEAAVFTKYLMQYQLYILFALIFGVTVLVRSLIKGIEGSAVAVGGAVLVVITSVYDMLVARGSLPYPYISQFGISFFMFLQGQVIAGRFATAFRTARRLSRSLKEEVDRQLAEIKEKTSEIRSVMDNIPQGIVYITDEAGSLSQVRSNFLDEIFDSKQHSLTNIHELLLPTNLDSDEKSKITSILSSSLGENDLTWEVNSEHLPRSVVLGGDPSTVPAHEKIIELDWHPVFTERGETAKILVTAHDVTQLRLIERKAHEKTMEAQRLNEVIGNKSFLLKRFFDASDEILKQVSEDWTRVTADSASLEQISKGLGALYGSLHTLKGMARTLKFSELSAQVHSTEDPLYQLLRGQKQSEPISKATIEALISLQWPEKFAKVQSSYQNYRTIYQDIAREWGTLSQSHEPQKASDFARECIEPELPLALELGKQKPLLNILGGAFVLTSMQSKIMQQVFVHMTRNALDHGLETPEERQRKQKAPQGEVKISLTQQPYRGQGGALFLDFGDDGRGLDLHKLSSRALSLGVITAAEAEDPHTVVMSLFREGFSSKETVTDISGRGVGMGEVKRLIEMVGGSIDLVPQNYPDWKAAAAVGPGPHAFRLEVILPAEALQQLAS